MHLRNLKYGRKIQVLFIPVFALMAVGLLIVYQIAAKSLKDEHRERLLRTAHLTEEGFKATEKEMMKLVDLFQTNRTLKEYLYLSTMFGGDREPLRGLLMPLVDSLEIDDLDLYDHRGRRVLTLDRKPLDDRKELHVAGITGAVPRQVMHGMTETSGTLKIAAVAPLTDRNGVVGYIAVGKYIDHEYLKALREISGNELFRIDTRNRFVSDEGEGPAAYISGESKLTRRGTSYSVLERDMAAINGASLGKLVIALSDDDLNAATNRLKLIMSGMLILAALLSYVMSRLFIRTLVDPLKTITAFTGKVARGELGDEIVVTGRDELSVLAGDFNDMQKQLKAEREIVESYTSNLEQRVEERTAELKKVQQQLLHAQKMEAIGKLAGGISHDFNNILTAILGYADMVKRRLPIDDPLTMPVDQIIGASKKAAALTHGLLAFSRKQVITPMPVDLNMIVRNVEKLLQRLIREDIELTSRLNGQELVVLADSVQLEQVLMNLVTNARDAMPEGGHLTIETASVEITDDFAKSNSCGKPGHYAVLNVSDTGVGMDAATKEKIFEPFFTTKEVGKGTGLGLAMVYGIVQQHEGCISVVSEPGKGTSLMIYLPIAHRDLQEPQPVERGLSPRRGTETVLLAEDDTMIRELARQSLSEAGYTVITASDGKDAVLRFQEGQDRIRLLIFDVVMPKKSGLAAYEEIRKIRPDIKILLTSGYTPDMLKIGGLLEKGVGLIQKPMSSDDLLRKVRTVLDA